MMRQNGSLVPQVMRPRVWLPFLGLKNRKARRRYLTFLFKREMKRANVAQKKEVRMDGLETVIAERERQVDTGEIQYGFNGNFLLRQINETSINHLYNWNSFRAHLFGNKFVFDCGYEKYMNSKEISSCIKQIPESYHINRMHNHPLHGFLCNLDPNELLAERLLRSLSMLYTDDFPWTVTNQSFSDIFDHSKLYYLTPHASNMMEEYDPDSVYIIGAYVDKGNNQPISLSLAKEHNLRMGKLPLNKYVHFGGRSHKNLTLNQVMGILLHAQTGDWSQGIKLYIPKRKLFESRMKYLEAKVMKTWLRGQNITHDEIKEQTDL